MPPKIKFQMKPQIPITLHKTNKDWEEVLYNKKQMNWITLQVSPKITHVVFCFLPKESNKHYILLLQVESP